MIRSVLFDLDRTLLDRDASFENFVASQYAKFPAALGQIPRDAYISRVIALDNRGALWKDKVYQQIVEEFAITKLSWQELFADFDSRIADHYLPFPLLRETLEALKKEGYSLGLITNGKGEFQMRSIRALGIEYDFKTILISEIVGLRKPDPEIFRQALRNLNCEPQHSVYVGDNPEVDINGARKAGMHTIWKQDDDFAGHVETDATFGELSELPPIIRDL